MARDNSYTVFQKIHYDSASNCNNCAFELYGQFKPARMRNKVFWLFGLPIDLLTTAQAVDQILDATMVRFPLVIATPNVNFLILASRDPTFRQNILNSDLILADGMPLLWIGRLLGIPIRQRVAGSTLAEHLMRLRNQRVKIFLFGGEAGAACEAATSLNASLGGLQAVGHYFPGFGSVDSMSTDSIIEHINQSGADFLSVSLGAQKGVEWIATNRQRIVIPIMCHLGAVVNFLAGRLRRAPTWMQRSGLEWLWRIKEQPSLWKRYFHDGLILTGMLAASFSRLLYEWSLFRFVKHGQHLCVQTDETESAIALRLNGNLDSTTLSQFVAAVENIRGDTNLVIDLDGINWIDCAALGYLYFLRYRCKKISVTLRASAKTARSLLRCHRALCLLEEN